MYRILEETDTICSLCIKFGFYDWPESVLKLNLSVQFEGRIVGVGTGAHGGTLCKP
jgi:hypothetical protein